MDNKVQMSSAITKDNNAGANAAMTGVMNALGQEGVFNASRMPIKNRINALDVSIKWVILPYFRLFYYRETQKKPLRV